MKNLFLILIGFYYSVNIYASDIPPTSRITLDNPARSQYVGYTGETLTFSSSTSSANCGTITQRRWRLNSGSYQYNTDFTQTFTLAAGDYEDTHTLELRTLNSCNLYHTVTITITIRRDQRVYFVKDHLGSVRSTVSETGDILGYDDYYPFGLAMPGRSSNTSNPNDNYKFTGHERDDEAGMTIDYMNARTYDPITGRFMQIDPLADQFAGWSPYNYTFNNPINFWDPDGRAPSGCCLISGQMARMVQKTKQIAQRKASGESWTSAYYNTFKNDAMNIVRYGTPVEDVYGMVTASDFEGNNYNRAEAAGWAAASFVPFAKLAKIPAKSLKVASYSFKHIASNRVPWSDVVKSTRNGPSKFLHGTDYSSLTREAWDAGTNVTNGKSWKVYMSDDVIGASSGKETKYMRVELTESTGELHSSPITKEQYEKLIKER